VKERRIFILLNFCGLEKGREFFFFNLYIYKLKSSSGKGDDMRAALAARN
jgi:hypothetical protein